MANIVLHIARDKKSYLQPKKNEMINGTKYMQKHSHANSYSFHDWKRVIIFSTIELEKQKFMRKQVFWNIFWNVAKKMDVKID